MKLLFVLVAHLLVTLARLARPGGVCAVAAESLAVKHQLLIMKRSQRRSPNLTAWDRLSPGLLYAVGFAQSLGQDCRGREKLDSAAASPSFGQAKVSDSIRHKAARSPWTQGSSTGADRRSCRDEAAEPILRLPQDRRANRQRLRHRH